MVLRVKRHPMVSLALPDRVAPDDFVRRRINHREDVLVLQIHIHFSRDGVVLRHSRFTIEVQGTDNFVLVHVHDGFGLPSLIGNV